VPLASLVWTAPLLVFVVPASDPVVVVVLVVLSDGAAAGGVSVVGAGVASSTGAGSPP